MPAHAFSHTARRAALSEMARAPVDLLVVGGGITGCGLARDAALRGLRVALVEAVDFGFGTSSRSTKIVHGGIRYLAYGDFDLVRESARERWVLRRIAPHLVHPVEFVYPLYADQWRLKYRLGFWLFDRLAGARGDEGHRMLDERAVRERVPGLRPELRGGGAYPEFVTDDARLTMENALSAALHGALVANHAPLERLLVQGGALRGAIVRDAESGREHEVAARVVVNATGVWAARTIELGATPPPGRGLVPSKGIHLLFPAERLPIAGATHVRASDGREGLAIRRGDFVYVGTTDVPYRGPLDRPLADGRAIEDVLRMTRDAFRGLDLSAADVVATWAGIRPLVAQPGRSTRDTSRKDEIWESPEGLITIVGGKLTTYRAMGERVMRRVLARLGCEFGPDRTRAVALPGALGTADAPDGGGARGRGGTGGGAALPLQEAVRARVREIGHDLEVAGVARGAAERIGWLYGLRAERLLDYGREDPRWLDALGAEPAVRGEVRLAIEEEMATTLEDVLDRRTSLLIFSTDQGRSAAPDAASILAERLAWDEGRVRYELDAYRALAAEHGPVAAT